MGVRVVGWWAVPPHHTYTHTRTMHAKHRTIVPLLSLNTTAIIAGNVSKDPLARAYTQSAIVLCATEE